MSTNLRAASLDGRRAASWWAARIPAWVLPALICAWFVVVLAATVGNGPACSATDPDSCGPDLGSALFGASLLGVPVLLWWSPVAGAAAGIVFGTADVLVDTNGSARVAFAVYGVACGVVAAWLARVRTTQRAVFDQPAGMPVTLPRVRPGGPRRSRLLAAAALTAVAVGLYAWYDHLSAVEDDHVAAAGVESVQIVAVGDGRITVVLASGLRHTVVVSDAGRYPTGSSARVLTDPGDPDWVRLVAEPDDPSGWAAGAFGAGAAALALTSREFVGWRARRRLVTGRHRGVQVRIMTDERGAALVYAADDVRGERPLAVVPVRWAAGTAESEPAGSGQFGAPGGWADERAFGRAWRGEVSEDVTAHLATLVGGMHDDAWPAFVIGDSAGSDFVLGEPAAAESVCDDVLLPTAPLRTFRSPPGTWWRFVRGGRTSRVARTGSGSDDSAYGLPGRPVPASGDAGVPDLPDLPAVVRGPGRYRAAGAAALGGGLLGAPIAVLLGLDVLPAAWLGGILLANGLFAVGRRVVLDDDRLTIRGAMVAHSVAWECLHGARLVGDRLVLAWEPATVVAVGPFAPVGESPGRREQAERTGAMMMTLRARSGASGASDADANGGVGGSADPVLSPGGVVTRAPAFGFVVVGAYILLVAAAWWWHVHHG
ncbi:MULTISPECIES: hypothetical protein [unclassified Frankia]|uniref:hypothetical protein n=1 Tax=unclassified Frankia TaxID=2632575 RepID=UPI002AD1E1F2|nr:MULTISPECIES: hypothetical protein [unclassified Frankia]